MRRILLMSVCIVAIAASAQGAGDASSDKAIQGTWNVVQVIERGESVKEELLKGGLTIVFDGDKVQTMAAGKPDKDGTFKLDPSKKPKTIDIFEGGKKEPALGIYSLEGDKLKLCFGGRKAVKEGDKILPAERPTELESTKTNGHILLILERKK